MSPAYAFPVQGYPKGKIPLHWSTSPNAADLFAAKGTPIRAIFDGRIEDASWNSAGGWSVYLIGGPDVKNLHVYMAHMMEKPMVVAGQRVTAGQQLGKVGDTGNAAGTGNHLHIGIGSSIKDGTGAEGGAGVPWDNNNANKMLQYILDTLGSGPIVPPPPRPVDYETPLRYLTDPAGPVLTALADLKSKPLKDVLAEIDNIRNEILRNRPA